MKIGRHTPVNIVHGKSVHGVWHAAYAGERPSHQWGLLPPQKPKVSGLLPLCGQGMMTNFKGLEQITWGKPTCRRCLKKLGAA